MKANQFRAMMLVLLMAVVSLGVVNAQTLTVTGTVTDVADGTPIVGCSVMLKGTTKGTVTNVNGQYAIQAKKGGDVVVSVYRIQTRKQSRQICQTGYQDES